MRLAVRLVDGLLLVEGAERGRPVAEGGEDREVEGRVGADPNYLHGSGAWFKDGGLPYVCAIEMCKDF